MKTKKKNNFIYLVYCNPEPIVYAVYKKKRKALEYANFLIKCREKDAKDRKHEFGFYHKMEDNKKDFNQFDLREKLIFSACLKIKDKSEFSDDSCRIQVVRRLLQ